jgi:hypothetical protein
LTALTIVAVLSSMTVFMTVATASFAFVMTSVVVTAVVPTPVASAAVGDGIHARHGRGKNGGQIPHALPVSNAGREKIFFHAVFPPCIVFAALRVTAGGYGSLAVYAEVCRMDSHGGEKMQKSRACDAWLRGDGCGIKQKECLA